jgi:hypothetical protein
MLGLSLSDGGLFEPVTASAANIAPEAVAVWNREASMNVMVNNCRGAAR